MAATGTARSFTLRVGHGLAELKKGALGVGEATSLLGPKGSSKGSLTGTKGNEAEMKGWSGCQTLFFYFLLLLPLLVVGLFVLLGVALQSPEALSLTGTPKPGLAHAPAPAPAPVKVPGTAPTPSSDPAAAPSSPKPVHAPSIGPLPVTPITSKAVRAQVLVIVSDHGSGTTDLGDALNAHPCMFDVGEPFANPSGLWSSSRVDGCAFPESVFSADTGALQKRDNKQLSLKMHQLQSTKPKGMKPAATLISESPSLYDGLPYDMAEYFIRIRDYLCASVPEDVCPAALCTITLKLFPQWVNANTGPQNLANQAPSRCTIARNVAAMAAWKKELASMKANPKVAAFTVTRDERNRQFSIFRRFTAPGTEFDCSFPRPPYTFADVSKSYTDGNMQIENCWKDNEGANKCLADALRLVGLSTEPLASKEINILEAEVTQLYNTTSRSCATDPDATFIRTESDVVPEVTHSDSKRVVRLSSSYTLPVPERHWGSEPPSRGVERNTLTSISREREMQ
jgi:hypothetical protein